MKYILIAVLALACLAAADQNDELVIANVKLTVPETAPVVYEHHVARDGVGIDISTIIAIGKQVWEIVKAGKPVVNYNTDWAGVVPKGVEWNDLAGFKDYKWGPFKWDFENVLGMTNVKFHWNFAWSCKGSYNGHGAFIMKAGAAVAEIYAAWGYTVDVSCAVDHNPINYGTKVDPIAGLVVEVTLNVKTVLQSFTEKCRVSLHGDCTGSLLACS